MGLASARTALAFSPVVTSVGLWNAVLVSKGGRALVISFDGLAVAGAEVRDEQFWDGAVWVPQTGVTGIRVVGDATHTITVAQLEAAIASSSALVSVSQHDPASTSTIDMDAMSGQEANVAFVLVQSRPAAAYARMLRALLPSGRVFRVLDPLLTQLLLGSADELARVDSRADDLADEADPTTALELLPEYERELDIDAASTIQERRANVVSRLLKQQRYRPVDFQTTLAPLLGLASTDVVVIERTRAFCIAIGDDREIFRFFIYRNPTLPGTYFIAAAQAIVADLAKQRGGMKPSHTAGYVIESINMKYDDPFSLYDRDILGA